MVPRPLAIAALLSTLACSASPQPSRPPADEQQLFALQSNFWVNLHHFLYVTSRARRGMDAGRTAVTDALRDTAGVGALSPSLRSDWDAALAYYGRAIAERDILFDSALVDVNGRLSHIPADGLPNSAALDADHGQVLTRAAGAYRALWWPRHDAANRRWIAMVRPLLAQHGDSAAAWEARAFGARWSAAPVPVDVSAYANWAGAYTSDGPGHITISSLNDGNQGTGAFEMLFHEVLHTMDRSLFEQYRSEARAQGKRMLRNPTHPFIFYTAGEVTRRLFPGYVPFAESSGIWTRSQDMSPMLPLLQRHWLPWLDGTVTIDESLRRIASEL
ncbi:MAG TPA: hypothetical protein VM076_00260 [Gemmatimonadaceae bacterium]|nr:hypothetical protein [Gemmatimonadaceae bacterium]